MSRVVNTAGATVREGQSGGFKPLPAAEYNVSIFDVIDGTYSATSAGQGRDSYRVQLRVSEGQAGANRRLFQTIPLFLEWGATAKNPQGSDAFTFYDFFAAVRGVSAKDYRAAVKVWIDAENTEALESIKNEKFKAEVAASAGKGLSIPDPAELLGKKINVVLKIVPDTYAFKKASDAGTLQEGETQADYLTNDVQAWKPFAAVEGAAAAGSVAAAAKDAFVL